MHASPISQHQLAKVKKSPLNVHCRTLLNHAGVLIHEGTMGAPELMLWTLENTRDQIDDQTEHTLREVVAMIQDKPSLVLSILEPPGRSPEKEPGLQEIFREQRPRPAGLLLLKHLKRRMDQLVDQEENQAETGPGHHTP